MAGTAGAAPGRWKVAWVFVGCADAIDERKPFAESVRGDWAIGGVQQGEIDSALVRT
jgi:hypothetical protein